MFKKLSLLLILTTSLSLISLTANAVSIEEAQKHYDKLQLVIPEIEKFYNQKIKIATRSASNTRLIHKIEIAKKKELEKINIEQSKLAQLILKNIHTPEDFLRINLARPTSSHRFARTDFWYYEFLTKGATKHILSICNFDVYSVADNIKRSFKLEVDMKLPVMTKNCEYIIRDLNTRLLSKYNEFEKNIDLQIKKSAVRETAPHSYNASNGDIVYLTKVILPILKNSIRKSELFLTFLKRKELSNEIDMDELARYERGLYARLSSRVTSIYYKQLEFAYKSALEERLIEYDNVKCCTKDANKENANKVLNIRIRAYESAIRYLEKIKYTMENDKVFKILSQKEGFFTLPEVTLKGQSNYSVDFNAKIDLREKMRILADNLKRQVRKR